MADDRRARNGRMTVALLCFVSLLVAGTSPVGALMPTLAQDEGGLGVALDSMRQLATDTRSNKEQRSTTRPRSGLPIQARTRRSADPPPHRL